MAVRVFELNNDPIRRAKTELYKLSMDEKEIERYRMREKALYDEISALDNAEKKGIEKGMLKEKLAIAKNLLDILDDETIAMKTGLEVYDIKKLR